MAQRRKYFHRSFPAEVFTPKLFPPNLLVFNVFMSAGKTVIICVHIGDVSDVQINKDDVRTPPPPPRIV